MTEYECCFCHDGMLPAETTALIVVLHWAFEAKQKEQQYFCHRACFERITSETMATRRNYRDHR